MFSFNIFFYGMSYAIQFFIFTLFLAVPHFPIQSYIYIIFFTSVVIYISRFVFQFIKLYKSLLEKILEMEEQNSIQIKHFEKVVSKHFPLSNEIFYLFVKIMFSALFFAIIYDTMQNVGYVKFGAQPDLTTIISLIFLFGPPRLVEALLTTEFTSRVHMKEKEIKEELHKIKLKNNTEDKNIKMYPQIFTDEEKKRSCMRFLLICLEKVKPYDSKQLPTFKSKLTCKECCKYRPNCFCLRLLGMFCCGCCNCPIDNKGFCEYCAIMNTGFDSKGSENDKVKITRLKMPCICIENEETEVKKLKNPENRTLEETDVKEPFGTDNEETEVQNLIESETKHLTQTKNIGGEEIEAKEHLQTMNKVRKNTEAIELTKIGAESLKTENKDGEETGTRDKNGVELGDIKTSFLREEVTPL